MVETSFSTARSKIEGVKKPVIAEKMGQERVDMIRMFQKVFKTKEGKEVLEELDKLSKHGHPDYINVNQQYSKIGQQQLVDHIKKIIEIKIK